MSIDSYLDDNEIQTISLKYFQDFAYRQIDIPAKGYKQNKIFEKLELDSRTAFVDQFRAMPTLNVICNLRSDRASCVRSIYKNYTAKYKKFKVGFAISFFVFDEVKIEILDSNVYSSLKSNEFSESFGAIDSFGLNPSTNIIDGYDISANIRAEIMQNLLNSGVPVSTCAHGDYIAQSVVEIDQVPIEQVADVFFITKYIIRQTVASYGKTVTFMARPWNIGVSTLSLSITPDSKHVKNVQDMADRITKYIDILKPFSNPNINGYDLLELNGDQGIGYNDSSVVLNFFDNLTNMYFSIPALLAIMLADDKNAKKQTAHDHNKNNAAFNLEDALLEIQNSKLLVDIFGDGLLDQYVDSHISSAIMCRNFVSPIELKLYYGAF